MKLLLFICAILWIAATSITNAQTNAYAAIVVTNGVYVSPAFPPNWANIQVPLSETYGGWMRLHGNANASITFHALASAPNWAEASGVIQLYEPTADASLSGFHISKNVFVTGDVNATGDIIAGGTPILWSTNIVWSTNTFYWPTNSQVAATINMGTPYGDLYVDGSAGPVTLVADSTSFLADSYQTAVVIVKNTSATVTNIVAPGGCHITGNPYLTNRTICTFFLHNWTNDVFTNMVCLPLW